MAEEFCGGANWWESTSTNRSSRFDGGASSTSSTTTGSCYGWLTEAATAVDINAARSSLESIPNQDNKMDGSSLLVGLGLSSQPMDWLQQPLLRNPEKTENSFRSMLQEGMGLNANFQQEASGGAMFGSNHLQWRDQKFPNPTHEETQEFKQIGRGFSLDQPQFSPSCSSMESTVTCQGFQLDSTSTSSVYCSPSTILQGFIGSDQQQQNQHHTPTNYQQNYFGMPVSNDHHSPLASSWTKVPQFLRAPSPKQLQQHQEQQQQLLHFTNNAPYWNASAPAVSMADIRPNFFSSLQNQLPISNFEEKTKNTLEARDSSTTVKKSAGENNNTNKRGRNEGASSTLPPFKVRKEKMGDRITALQQLVSPFGKTDTASVLSEAIEYIKFLHEQVSVLSTPYLKSGASYQQHHQPSNEKAKSDLEVAKQDLRSRGLCLVPVSSTFPMTHETTVDFWTPTFGGTFR